MADSPLDVGLPGELKQLGIVAESAVTLKLSSELGDSIFVGNLFVLASFDDVKSGASSQGASKVTSPLSPLMVLASATCVCLLDSLSLGEFGCRTNESRDST